MSKNYSKNWRDNSLGIETPQTLIRKVARELNLNSKRTAATIRSFFSCRGLKHFTRHDTVVRVKGLGTFKANGKGKKLNKQKDKIRKINERIRKNKYNRKRQSQRRNSENK